MISAWGIKSRKVENGVASSPRRNLKLVSKDPLDLAATGTQSLLLKTAPKLLFQEETGLALFFFETLPTARDVSSWLKLAKTSWPHHSGLSSWGPCRASFTGSRRRTVRLSLGGAWPISGHLNSLSVVPGLRFILGQG